MRATVIYPNDDYEDEEFELADDEYDREEHWWFLNGECD